MGLLLVVIIINLYSKGTFTQYEYMFVYCIFDVILDGSYYIYIYTCICILLI